MLRLGSLADSDDESTTISKRAVVDSENIALVAVVALIERPQQPDPRLDRQDCSSEGVLAVSHARDSTS
jgi:hypothetical protein